MRLAALLLLSGFGLYSCGSDQSKTTEASASEVDSLSIPPKGSYGYDFHFLKQYESGLVELTSTDQLSKVLVSPRYQGRVMTSTAAGSMGTSFGWINYDLISKGRYKEQFNPFGGEERFWLGPEGGPFALYFKKGDSFQIQHWQVPAILDTISYQVANAASDRVRLTQQGRITNYHGFTFDFAIERSVILMNAAAIQQRLRVTIPETLRVTGYETVNSIQNTSDQPWKKETGLMSIWLLGMFPPSDQSTVIIPFKEGSNSRTGITDNYFGKIPPERLRIEKGVLYLTADGKWRSKVGIAPRIAGNVAAAVDLRNNILHIVYLEVDRQGHYVNSLWEQQKDPYSGDVVNAYNDGPLADGKQLGPFFEIESSSAAKELLPGEKQEYRQMTCHIQGTYEEIKKVAFDLLGVDIGKLKK